MERRDMLFTGTCGEGIQHLRQINCMMCFTCEEAHETQRLGLRGSQTAQPWNHQQFYSVHTTVVRSQSDLLWKEENRTLFAGLVNLRAFRLMVSEPFLPTCWNWIETARRVWYLMVSVTKCHKYINLIIVHRRFLKINTWMVLNTFLRDSEHSKKSVM